MNNDYIAMVQKYLEIIETANDLWTTNPAFAEEVANIIYGFRDGDYANAEEVLKRILDLEPSEDKEYVKLLEYENRCMAHYLGNTGVTEDRISRICSGEYYNG